MFDSHGVNPSLIQNMPFDTLKDLAPVMLVGTAPLRSIATAPSKPYRTLADVVQAARAKPDAVSFGSVGNGTMGHLVMTQLQQSVGVKLVHIP